MKGVLAHWRELFHYRVLIYHLVRRELKARYRGSALGYLWTLLNPLLLLTVYVLVFSRFTRAVRIPDYAVFILVGILPWLWFSSSVSNGSMTLVSGASLITRVCIPPQVLPAVEVLSNLVNFLFSLPVAFAACFLYDRPPGASLLLLPLIIAIQLIFLYGVTLFVSSVTVLFRDVRFLVQNLLMFWFFLTPIAYPFEVVPESYRPFVLANPATALIVPYQSILYEGQLPQLPQVALAGAWALVVVALAIRVYESLRKTLVEEV